MNIEVLKHIVSNEPSLIEDIAQKHNLDSSASVGVARQLVAQHGNLAALSQKQRHHYDQCISPLLENVPCDGIYGEGTCTGNGFIDDDTLLGCYLEGDFLCQLCRYDAERISRE
ncbi:hypothetical protein [Zobellella sp. DQSA1]|uniref:hypothetical protein n=1 Tax=Zobellella sp. DQSA1 TaxID=3342386 RepID=UPI0035C1DD7F